jgi:glycine hydroxymethyltransferase
MVKVAEFIERVLNAPEDESVIAQVRSEVNAIMANYPIFAY